MAKESARLSAEETGEFRTVTDCEALNGKVFSHVNRWVIYFISGFFGLIVIGYTIVSGLSSEVSNVKIKQEGTKKDIEYIKENIDDVKTEQRTMKREILDEIRKAK